MSSGKQGGVAGWVQITIAVIGVLGTVAVARLSMPVRFQGTVGQGKPDTAPELAGATGPKPKTAPPVQPAPPTPTLTSQAATTEPTDKSVSAAAAPPSAVVRNPFGVEDVFDVEGPDVKAFAAAVNTRKITTLRTTQGEKEPNAPQWAGPPVGGVRGSIEGEWASRWRTGLNDPWQVSKATVWASDKRVFILFSDPKPSYLIEAVREGKTRLVGRYINLKNPKRDNSPWVAEVVSDERIDGKWSDGRWDLQRQLQRIKGE